MTKLMPADFDPFFEKSTALLLHMANANRLAVLQALVDGETSVGVLAVKLGLSAPALSQHLSRLRTAKLVEARRNAQNVFYSCTSPEVSKVLLALASLSQVKHI